MYYVYVYHSMPQDWHQLIQSKKENIAKLPTTAVWAPLKSVLKLQREMKKNSMWTKIELYKS
jgi:hypothetical protein